MWEMPWELTAAQVAASVLLGLLVAAAVVWALAHWLIRLDRDAAAAQARDQLALPPLEELVQEERRAVRWREVNR